MEKPICTIDDDYSIHAGTKRWKLSDGTYHREDGPSVEYPNGDYCWHFNGVSHREDGPAIEWHYHGANNKRRLAVPKIEWWYHGKQIYCRTQQEFERIIKMQAFW
jgi:hypothetical protein